MLAEILQTKINVSDRNGARTVSKWEAVFEVLVAKALRGDLRAVNALIQMTEKLGVFKWEPPEVSYVSMRDQIIEGLYKMGKLPPGYPRPGGDVDEKQTETGSVPGQADHAA
jgi:hypothetical protein